MHILHALFTPVMGGLEQAYLNITEALASRGHRVTALLHKDAPYRPMSAQHATIETLQPKGFYDPFAVWKARKLIKNVRPDLILAHNARAIVLMTAAGRGTAIPVVGVSHSYKTKRTVRADALIMLTEHMRRHFIKAGYREEKLFIIPNLIHLPEKFAPRERHSPIVLGSIGRLAPNKGYHVFLDALAELKKMQVPFVARIAGEGPEMGNLKAQAAALNLSEVEFIGWAKDKDAFYREIDIFCVPSVQESFGIVLLEAWIHGVPIVATDTEGPSDIMRDGIDGMLAKTGDAKAFAEALARVASDPELATRMAEAGWQAVQRYSFPAVAAQWDKILLRISAAARIKKAA